jgi:hypothetical protein
MLGSFLLLGLWGPAMAQPVIVTDFRSTASDASVAFMLYNALLQELDQSGFSVVDGERVWNRMRVNPMECGADAKCRRDMLLSFESPLALVGEASTDGGTIAVTVRFYSWEKPNPIEIYQEWIEPGQEGQVLQEIVRLTDGLHARLPVPGGSSGSDRARSDRDREDTRTRKEEQRREEDRRRAEEDRRREDDRRQAQEDRRREDAPGSRGSDLDREEEYLDELLGLDDETYAEQPSTGRNAGASRSRQGNENERSAMGIPEFLYRKYLSSGLGADEWLKAKRVRQRALSIELQGGIGRGDTDRSYDVRVAIDSQTDEHLSVSSFDTLLPGQWPQGMVGIGFNPTPWLEFSLLGGVQYGRKYLTVGWERFDGDTLSTGDATAFDAVPAISAVIEPRVRLYPLMTGFFKPFFTLGYNLRIMDDYDLTGLSTVDYPSSDGRVIHGVTLGAGAMIDVHPRVAIVFDVPFTWELSGHKGRVVTSPHLTDVPLPCVADEPPCQWGYLVRFSAGLQIRI